MTDKTEITGDLSQFPLMIDNPQSFTLKRPEPPHLLAFHNTEDPTQSEPYAKLFVKDGVVTFEGDCDRAAKQFMETLAGYFEQAFQQTRDDALREVQRKIEALRGSRDRATGYGHCLDIVTAMIGK